MFEASARESSHDEGAEHEHEEEESGGSPLPMAVRAKMEGAFGADFSSVRVHQGNQAAAVGAQAYTQGSNIHFAPGHYDPDSSSGQELLGHELAHVVQQGSGRASVPQAKGADLGGSEALEREADSAGAAAARGERVNVTGNAAGAHVQFKKPVDRSWLDAAKATESPRIAATHVEELKKRLSAKAELAFTNTEDGALIQRLEEAASNKVKEIAGTDLAGNAKGKADVEALSAKIAQRSKAVKQAVSEKSKTIAADIASGGYLATFKAATDAAFDTTSVSRISIKALVIQQAIASAKIAASRIDEAEYQKAKTALDTKLATDKATIETDLTTDSESKVEKRAHDATKKRGDVDAKLDLIAKEAREPVFKGLHDEVEKYVANGLGANGASWLRSDELREFRKQMKTAARNQAKKDISTDLGGRTNLGKAQSRFVGSEAQLEAYDEAKESVNTKLAEVATQMTDKLMLDELVEDGITVAARQAAFGVYEDDGHMPAAKTAASTAAKAHAKNIHNRIMTLAKTRKNAIVKPAGPAPVERQEIQDGVIQQVKDDEVGKRSVDAAIKASDTDEGMSKLGHFFDFMVPERGDAIKFKVTLEVPAGPGNVLLEFQGDAERGTRERLLHKDHSTGQKTVERDTQSLKLGAEIRIGYSGTFPGIKIQGALGFFMRSDAASTGMCMKALSYGIYRFLTSACPPLANLWGGSSKKATAMAETDPTTPDDNMKDDVYRSELWAAMVEEQVFKKDKEARVDLGMSLSGGAEVDGGVAKAKAGLRFEGMRTYDHQAFKKSIAKYNSTHTGQQVPGGVKLGDDQFDKVGALERREAISGRTTGAFVFESEVEVDIASQKSVFGLKVKITPPDFEIELSGGIKLTSTDPAGAQARLYAGIASASQNGLKLLISLIRNLIDKDHAKAGILGGVADAATRSLVDVNNITQNSVGDMAGNAYQVTKGSEDFANQGINQFLGGSPPDPSVPVENTKAGYGAESVYKASIVIGSGKFLVKIDEVQAQKVKVGGSGGPGLGIEYEKSRRVGQIGVSGGRFHAEGMGVSTKT